eukprot:UN18415
MNNQMSKPTQPGSNYKINLQPKYRMASNPSPSSQSFNNRRFGETTQQGEFNKNYVNGDNRSRMQRQHANQLNNK